MQKNVMVRTKNHLCLDSPQIFSLFTPKYVINDVIIVNTNRRINLPALEIGEFLQFIGIWMLTKAITVPNQTDWYSVNPIDIFGR